MSFLTIGEAIAWICTRDHEKVKEICGLPRARQLRNVTQKYLEGTFSERRARIEKHPPVGAGAHASSQQALKGLQAAIMQGAIAVRAYGSGSPEAVPVSDLELRYLGLRMCNDEPASYGLWSEQKNKFLWLEPLFPCPIWNGCGRNLCSEHDQDAGPHSGSFAGCHGQQANKERRRQRPRPNLERLP